MKLLILGATGRTGKYLVRRAFGAGHDVVTFGRRKPEGQVPAFTGQFGDAAFEDAVLDADVVLSCLASTNTSPTCSTATRAILKTDPNVRYVLIAGAALAFPTDKPGVMDKVIGATMGLVLGKMQADRRLERDLLVESRASWTILRPPRLVEGRATGKWLFSDDRPQNVISDRDDLARAMLAAVDDTDMARRAPFVATVT